MSQRVALITVVYQNYSVLNDLFNSLEKQTDHNFRLFISDLSKNKKDIKAKRLSMTITNGENKGYAHGVNLGLKKAVEKGFDLFCVINNDTIVSKKFISSLIQSLNSHPSSIIGGKIYYAPGYEYHKKRYSKKDIGRVIWYAGGSIDWKNVFITHQNIDTVDTDKKMSILETDFVSGCLMAFDKLVLNSIGYWDERYFLYYEDADYCVRAQKKGIKLYYDPAIVMWHKNAQSTEGSGSKLHQRYQEKNRTQFALKYAPPKTQLHILKNYLVKKIS